MEISERAKIRLEHWITHNDHHQEEYEIFADQLEEANMKESARHVRDLIDLTSKCTDCLREALKSLK
jgi:hypothetical protein